MTIPENRLIDNYNKSLYNRTCIYRQQCALSKRIFSEEIENNRKNSKANHKNLDLKTFLPKMDIYNESLNYFEKLIFFNEIWNVNPDKYWYKGYFSKSTYYKFLHSVLDSFCEFLNA